MSIKTNRVHELKTHNNQKINSLLHGLNLNKIENFMSNIDNNKATQPSSWKKIIWQQCGV